MKKLLEGVPQGQRRLARVLVVLIFGALALLGFVLLNPPDNSEDKPAETAAAASATTTTSTTTASHRTPTTATDQPDATTTTVQPPAVQQAAAQSVRPASTSETNDPDTTAPPAPPTTVTTQPSTPPAPPTTEPLGVEKRYVTIESATYLSTRPVANCADLGCAVAGTQLNPGESMLEVNCYGGGWYGILRSGSIVYIPELALIESDRHGLGLPSCALY